MAFMKLIFCPPSLLQYTPHPLIPQRPVLSSPLPLFPRGFQEMTRFLAHRDLKPVHFSPDLRRPTTPFPHHAAPTSVTACATTSILMQPLLHRAHSTYACKTTVSSLTLCRNHGSGMVWFQILSACCPVGP